MAVCGAAQQEASLALLPLNSRCKHRTKLALTEAKLNSKLRVRLAAACGAVFPSTRTKCKCSRRQALAGSLTKHSHRLRVQAALAVSPTRCRCRHRTLLVELVPHRNSKRKVKLQQVQVVLPLKLSSRHRTRLYTFLEAQATTILVIAATAPVTAPVTATLPPVTHRSAKKQTALKRLRPALILSRPTTEVK